MKKRRTVKESRFDTKEFRKLRTAWYKKLERSGFRDIEIFHEAHLDPESVMHGVSTGDLRRSLYKPETEEYFSLARGHVHDIEDPRIRLVWALHAEGWGITNIFNVVKDVFVTKRYHVLQMVRVERMRMFNLVRERCREEADQEDR
jgi:hypothetical protein